MKVFNAVVRMVTAGVLIAIAGSAAAQQDYPSKQVRFVTPYPPGGSTTVLSRLVGYKLSESWGQQFIVDNRPGGNTIIGHDIVAKSAPDGYTILLVTSTLSVLPSLYRTLPYDTLKDVAPVATISVSPQLLVIHPSLPANNLQEFTALAKSRPGELNYATSAAGGPTHLSSVLFEMLTGAKLQHVPYKGAGPGVTDLLGGQVHVYFIVPINAIAHVKSGRLRAIAITGESRLATLPQVPTFAEAGMPSFDMETWYGIGAPGATPKAIVDKLSAEVAKILRMPDIREKLESQGMRPTITTPEQFSAMVKSEIPRYAKIIKAGNIEVQQ